MKTADALTTSALMRRVAGWVKPHSPALAGGMLLGLGGSIGMVYIAALQQRLIDQMTAGHISALYRSLVAGALVIIGATVVGSVGGVMKGYIKAKIAGDFRLDTFDHVNRLPMESADAMHSGDLVSRATSDASKATTAFTNSLCDAFDITATMTLAFVYLARIDVVATLAAAACGPIIFLSGRLFDRGIRTRGEQIQKTQADLRQFLQDNLQGSSVVAAYGLEGEMTQRFEVMREQSRKLNLAQALSWSGLYHVGDAVNTIAMLGCALLVAYQAAHGHLSGGSVLAFVILVNRVTWPVVGLSRVWGGVQEGLGSAKRVFEVMDMPAEGAPVGTTGSPAIAAGQSSSCALEFTRVGFSYASRGNVLTDVSLRVNRGEMVAVVGPSGSGKSTLAKLALALYTPTSGSVTVAGHDTRRATFGARAAAAYVPQNPRIFACSLLDNVAAGSAADDPESQRAAVGRALDGAGLTDVVAQLSDGLDTAVGEKGTGLSGGQGQRVALARAMMRDASLVVLDEATSALDNETEAFVQRSIDAMRGNAGLLVIAHRLTTIMNADRILVMEEGRITEEGTHAQLLAARGTYHRLWTLAAADADPASRAAEQCSGVSALSA